MSKAAKVLIMGIVCLGTSFLASNILAAPLKDVTGEPGSPPYQSAIKQNFDRVKSEFSNTVHKTGTETIHGEKTFVDDTTFGAVTVSTLAVNVATINTSLSMGGAIDMNSHKITELTNGSASSDAAAFGQIPVVATQAQQETGTSNAVFVSPGVQQSHSSAAKVWTIFRGTGTVTDLASQGISSIGDNGVGDYTLNFTTSFSSVNFVCVCMPKQAAGGGHRICEADNAASSESSIRIRTIDTGGGAADGDRVNVVCFGDQ